MDEYFDWERKSYGLLVALVGFMFSDNQEDIQTKEDTEDLDKKEEV